MDRKVRTGSIPVSSTKKLIVMTRRSYRKHSVVEPTYTVSAKAWMRDNQDKFTHIKGVPTSEQIGTVFMKEGYARVEDSVSVTYRRVS